MNWVNNYYKPGPATGKKVRHRIFQLSDAEIEDVKNNSPEDSKKYETTLYAEGNFVDGSESITNNNWTGGQNQHLLILLPTKLPLLLAFLRNTFCSYSTKI